MSERSKQYQRTLINSLYFLEVQADRQLFYKIGITSRQLDDRLPEIKKDLLKHFESVSIKELGFWQHRGNVEYYFKYRYRLSNYHIGNLTEYFTFDNIDPVITDLKQMKPKILSEREREILNFSLNRK